MTIFSLPFCVAQALLCAAIIVSPIVACMPQQNSASAPAAGRHGYVRDSRNITNRGDSRSQRLGSVNGKAIYFKDLGADIAQQVRDAENEQAQRRLHLSWVGFEEQIDSQLIADAAAKQGVSTEQYRETAINSKIEMPSDEELKAIYELNKESIPVSFADAKKTLRYQLTKQRRQSVEQALSQALRASAQITYTLPVPELPRYPVETKDGARKGPDNAAVTIVEFSDFECPYCSRAKESLERIATRYPNKVAVVFRDFPLGQHKNAKPAAIAARCAGQQGKFWVYHDRLFDSQGSLGSDSLLRHGRDVELDMTAFSTCLESPEMARAVAADMADGRRYGVSGTPAIFINGIKLIGLLPMPLLQAIIDSEIARKEM